MFDWITAVINAMGALGVGLMMLLENVFPPIPSEIVMPLAGFLVARGEMSLTLTLLAGTAGAVAGAALWYWIGLRIGAERLKRLARRHGIGPRGQGAHADLGPRRDRGHGLGPVPGLQHRRVAGLELRAARRRLCAGEPV